MKKSIKILFLITICLFLFSIDKVSAVNKDSGVSKYCYYFNDGITESNIGSISSEKGDLTINVYKYVDTNGDVKCIQLMIKKKGDKSKTDRSIKFTWDFLESINSTNDSGINLKKITKDNCKNNSDECIIGKDFSQVYLSNKGIEAIKNGNELQIITNSKNNLGKNAAIGAKGEDFSSALPNYDKPQDNKSKVPGKDNKNNNKNNNEVYDSDGMTYEEISATDCDSLLGSVDNPDEPAYYLELAFTIIKYVAIIILIVFSMKDFAMAIIKKDEEAVKNATAICVKRFVYCVIIFVLPILVKFILNWSHIVSTNPLCGIGGA